MLFIVLFNLQVVVTSNAGMWSAFLETHASADVNSRMLPAMEGCILEPHPAELSSLFAGTAYLDLRAADNDTALLRTRLPQVIKNFDYDMNYKVCLLKYNLMFFFCFLAANVADMR